MITPAQCRMARAGLGWGTKDLALAANVSISTISRFELSGVEPPASSLQAIQHTLEAAGIEFTNGGEPGVKLRKKIEE